AQSLVDLLLDEVPEVSKQIVELARSSLFALVDEIQKQKQLLAVECNEYTKTILTLQGIEVISNIAKEFRQHPKCIGKNLIVATDSENIQVITDYTLLRRILVNMVVNALEATCAGGDVTIGLQKNEKFAQFWVHNKEVIPELTRLQIFKRSFSTKGADRGLGTYSIKLLAENYLGASVGFSSSEDSGTCFWLNLKTSH
ncbi:MAG: HAMP domain-containing histidine kinase, partial [Negativicutes bacterium]|nr:HAMP domain-containing histidine kinase [Negativicutes bacterium]